MTDEGDIDKLRRKVSREVVVPEKLLGLPFKEAKRVWADVLEKQYLQHNLDQHRGNLSKAAASSGISRRTFLCLMKKLEIRRKKWYRKAY